METSRVLATEYALHIPFLLFVPAAIRLSQFRFELGRHPRTSLSFSALSGGSG